MSGRWSPREGRRSPRERDRPRDEDEDSDRRRPSSLRLSKSPRERDRPRDQDEDLDRRRPSSLRLSKSPRERDTRERERSRSRDRPPPARFVWGNVALEEGQRKPQPKEEPKAKANFALSGALAKDETTGNTQNGVVLKFSEPLDTALPSREWRLYVFKGDSIVESIHIDKKPAYLFGRDPRVADIVLLHPASSKQHAVIQFRKTKVEGKVGVRPYLLDLESANKTYLNGAAIEESRYYELREKDTIRFGLSDREYVLLCADAIVASAKKKT